MNMVIHWYEIKASEADELNRIIGKRFLPLVRKVHGFISYSWVKGSGGEMFSVGLFNDEAAAEEANRIASEFMREHLSEFSVTHGEVITGEVVHLQGS